MLRGWKLATDDGFYKVRSSRKRSHRVDTDETMPLSPHRCWRDADESRDRRAVRGTSARTSGIGRSKRVCTHEG